MAKNYIEDAYIEGLKDDEIEFMKVFNLKVFADRAGISYNLLRKGVKGEKIPRSVDKGLWTFLSKLDVKIKKILNEK